LAKKVDGVMVFRRTYDPDSAPNIQLSQGDVDLLRAGWEPIGCVPLVLPTSNILPLSELPAASQGRVRLKIARKDIETAERFVEDFHDRHENVA